MSIKRLTNTNKGVTTIGRILQGNEEQDQSFRLSGRGKRRGYLQRHRDQMEEKENGSYLFLSKKDNGVVFEYKVDILDESFNLSYVHITANNDTFHIDFDN